VSLVCCDSTERELAEADDLLADQELDEWLLVGTYPATITNNFS
jgi:hypothetical protein